MTSAILTLSTDQMARVRDAISKEMDVVNSARFARGITDTESERLMVKYYELKTARDAAHEAIQTVRRAEIRAQVDRDEARRVQDQIDKL